MVREEFKLIVKGLKSIYLDKTFIPDQIAFDMWFELLKDIPYKLAEESAIRYMSTNSKPPTPADIRKGCVSIVESEDISEDKAWDLVYRAICNSNIHAEEEFNRLPDVIQRTIGSPNRLRAMACDNHFNMSVESSNFKKAYRTIKERDRYDAQLPHQLGMLIQKSGYLIKG